MKCNDCGYSYLHLDENQTFTSYHQGNQYCSRCLNIKFHCISLSKARNPKWRGFRYSKNFVKVYKSIENYCCNYCNYIDPNSCGRIYSLSTKTDYLNMLCGIPIYKFIFLENFNICNVCWLNEVYKYNSNFHDAVRVYLNKTGETLIDYAAV